MAQRKQQQLKVSQYDFTFPGTVAFYEGMDSAYLQELYFKKLKAHERATAEIAAWRYKDKPTLEWIEKKVAQIRREMLTIQQILNSRR